METDTHGKCVLLDLAERLWEQPGEVFGIREGFSERRHCYLVIHHAMYSINKYLLNAHSMSGPGLGAEDTAANISDKFLCLHGVSIRISRKHRGISRTKEAMGGKEGMALM